MQILGRIKLRFGEPAFYDEVSRIYLNPQSREINITDTMDLRNIVKSIKSGRLELITGEIPAEIMNPPSASGIDIKTHTVDTVEGMYALTNTNNGDTAIVKTDSNNGNNASIYVRENSQWVLKQTMPSGDAVGNTNGLLTNDKTVVGAINELFTSASNGKQAIVTAIAGKGIEVSNDDTFSELAGAITGMSTSAKKVKINVTAPYVKSIPLQHPTGIEDLCTSVLSYVAGPGEVRYECEFDNADATNFQPNENVLFDGKMRTPDSFDYPVAANASQIYESETIDLSKFTSVSSITFTDSSVNLAATIPPQLVLPLGDINLSGIDSLDSIVLSGSATGTSQLLLIMSFDSGVTWKSYNGTAIVDVNIADMNDVKAKGMPMAVVNTDLATILNENPVENIRFGYFLEQNDAADTCESDKITINVIMQGSNSICPQDRYVLGYDEATSTITYTINTNGTYIINYVG